MACCGSIPPGTAPTTGSAAAALVAAVAGAPSSSLANYGGGHLIVTHFLGRDVHNQVFALARHPAFPALEQGWNRGLHGDGHLTVAAAEQLLQLVRAYTGSGLPGWDSNCRRAVWKNMGSSFPCEARRSPVGAGCLQGHCLTRVALPSRPRDRYAPALGFLQSAGSASRV